MYVHIYVIKLVISDNKLFDNLILHSVKKILLKYIYIHISSLVLFVIYFS